MLDDYPEKQTLFSGLPIFPGMAVFAFSSEFCEVFQSTSFNRTPLDHCFVYVTSVWLYTRPWKRNSYLSCQDHQPLANNTFDKVHDHVTYIIILHVYPVNLIVLALDAVDRIK